MEQKKYKKKFIRKSVMKQNTNEIAMEECNGWSKVQMKEKNTLENIAAISKTYRNNANEELKQKQKIKLNK